MAKRMTMMMPITNDRTLLVFLPELPELLEALEFPELFLLVRVC